MDTSQLGPRDVAAAAERSWRRHSTEFKARVIELARQSGTSMAAVALANGLNANMLRRWVHEAAASGGASKSDVNNATPALASFVQLPMHQPEPQAVLDAQPAPPAVQQPAEITGYHPEVEAAQFVSLLMPVRTESYSYPELHPVFRMNLPEGFLLSVLQEKLGPHMGASRSTSCRWLGAMSSVG